jgi:tRNA wybutosine-synthesizing protein 4
MDFTAKNFKYVTTGFGEFARRAEQGDKLYLRALSQEKPSEKPAVLADDFPGLAPDFVLPTQLSLVAENLFSSVLRMSGPVNMWLHYDVSWLFLSLSFSFFLLFIPPQRLSVFFLFSSFRP